MAINPDVSQYKYIAAATDMDGSLLQPDHNPSEYAKKVVAALYAKKVPFVLATGRHHSDVLVTLRKLGLSGYVLTSNGARVHDPSGNVLIRRDMNVELVKELVDMGVADEYLVTNIYQEDHWYMNKDASDLCEYYQANKESFYRELFDPTTHSSYKGTYKVYYSADEEHYDRLYAMQDAIVKKYGDRVSALFSLPNCLEVTSAGVNKGTTLGMLLKHFFPNDPRSADELLQHTIAFGDGENDYYMLTMVGRGCVMGNAQENLLSKLPKDCPTLERIGSNSEDAVAHRLSKEFHLGL